MERFTLTWKRLSTRERILMTCLGLLITGYCVYRYIWVPVNEAIDLHTIRVQEKINQYETFAPRIESTKRALTIQDDQLTARFEGNAMIAVEEGVAEIGLKDQLSLASPAGDAISVWFTNVDFNKWLKWVNTMRERGIVVNEAKVATTAGREGIVTIKALVRPVR